jgi:hypothetical protein
MHGRIVHGDGSGNGRSFDGLLERQLWLIFVGGISSSPRAIRSDTRSDFAAPWVGGRVRCEISAGLVRCGFRTRIGGGKLRITKTTDANSG